MKKLIHVFVTLATLVFCCSAETRPVSYTGGWTLVETSHRVATSSLIHYTSSPVISTGWRMEYHRKDEVLIQAIQSNWLVNRWFGKDYQGNLYAFGGLGIAQDRSPLDKSSDITLFTGLMADWETRS